MTDDINQKFFKAVGRHFVTLSCVQYPLADFEQKLFLVSGFIAEIGGVWFYVTAGHILRDIRTALNLGYKFGIWQLGDQTAGNRFKDTAIPYDFDIENWAVVEDEQYGLDYAALPLSDMYCRLLSAGGVVPIGKDAWGDHLMEHVQWILVGIPSETVKYDGKNIIVARPAMIPIESVEPPEEAGLKAQNKFYGRLHQDSVAFVKDIDGMSGGPIFATKKVEGEMRYFVIGIQSSWYKHNRVIAACPFSSLGKALEEIVDSVLTPQEKEDK